MSQFSLAQRLKYRFDNIMAQGTIALIMWLALATISLTLTVAALVYFLSPAKEDGGSYGFRELVWMSFMRELDAGTMGGDQGSWIFLTMMLTVTIGGIFIVGTLIGIITTGVDSKLSDLSKGRSFVAEHNHTLILGWSNQIFTIIDELTIANESQKSPCIVILADKDKVEMQDEIRAKISRKGKTRVVCRSGNPIDLNDLEIVNLPGARSIIVPSPENDDPDSEVIKTILAVTNNPKRRAEPYHIVAEIRDEKNLEAARLVGGEEAQLVVTGDIISRVIAQTCRQSGLSVVYTELLDFGGDEIYFHEEPSLVGKTFSDSMLVYDTSTVIGMQFRDLRVALNPPMDTVIAQGDKMIVIAEDNDKIKLSGITDHRIDQNSIEDLKPHTPEPERTLILGWNRHAPVIIKELDNYVAPGSITLVIADGEEGRTEIERRCSNLVRQTVEFREGNTTDRSTLDSLDIGSYNHVIVLCYSDTLEIQRADARTLVTLLHLRDIESKTNKHATIVSEMLDVRNRDLAEVTKADDFIISDRLISLMLSQISENKYLNAIFTDIFDADGSEIYIRSVTQYVRCNQPVNFYTVVASARRYGHIAIGYRIHAHRNDASKAYGVVVNPVKSKVLTFSPDDSIIVVAED